MYTFRPSQCIHSDRPNEGRQEKRATEETKVYKRTIRELTNEHGPLAMLLRCYPGDGSEDANTNSKQADFIIQ